MAYLSSSVTREVRILEDEKCEFSDWQIKRLRYKLLVYLNHLQFAYDNPRKFKSKIPSTNKGDAGRGSNSRPSWTKIAFRINGTETCSQWINKKDNEGRYCDATYNKLFQFVIGQPDRKIATFKKYTLPNKYLLRAIYEFLKFNGFITQTDIQNPIQSPSRDQAFDYFNNNGLKPKNLFEHQFFNGDYISSSKTSTSITNQKSFHVHTEFERHYDHSLNIPIIPQLYCFKIIGRHIHVDTTRIADRSFEHSGWGVFSHKNYAVFFFNIFDGLSHIEMVGIVNGMKLDDTIIATKTVKKTRKIVSIDEQVQYFSFMEFGLPNDRVDFSLKICDTCKKVDRICEQNLYCHSKSVFTKRLEQLL